MKKIVILALVLTCLLPIQAQENIQNTHKWTLQLNYGIATALNYSGISLIDYDQSKFNGQYYNCKIGWKSIYLDVFSSQFNMRYNSELTEANNIDGVGLLLRIPNFEQFKRISFIFNVGIGLMFSDGEIYYQGKDYDPKMRFGSYGKFGLELHYNIQSNLSLGIASEMLHGFLNKKNLPTDIRIYQTNHVNDITMFATSIVLKYKFY